MQLLRNRSTRSLWDPNYVDESWIASTGINGGSVNLINLMKNWVNTYYPGTKIGITEYNWGAEGHMNGATTQADIWGIFGREGLDLANRWTTPATGSPTYLAMKMYRNYDGNDSTFGDTSVAASGANPDQVSAFASIRSSDGALTGHGRQQESFSGSTSATINVLGFSHRGTAQPWQLTSGNTITRMAASPSAAAALPFSCRRRASRLFVLPTVDEQARRTTSRSTNARIVRAETNPGVSPLTILSSHYEAGRRENGRNQFRRQEKCSFTLARSQ